MRKYLKYAVYILSVSSFAVICLYQARTFIFVPLIQKYIHAETGYKVKFDNFCISPFSLTLMNVTAGSAVAAQKIKFKFNLAKIFTCIASPLKLINRIDISKLEICLNGTLKSEDIFLGKKSATGKLLNSGITLFADEAVIRNNTGCLRIANTSILIKPSGIDIDFVMYILGIPVKFSSIIKRSASSSTFNALSVFTADSRVNMLINSSGTVDLSSLNVTQNIAVEKLICNGFSLDGALGAFSKKAESYNMDLWGNFGKFKFNYLPGHISKAKSNVDISKINENMSGNINLDFKGLDGAGVLVLNVTKFAVMGFECGDFNFLGAKNRVGIYNASCVYGNGKKIELVYMGNGNYKLKVVVKNRTMGIVEGNIKTGGISVDIKNIDIGDIPIIPFMFKNAEGVVSIFGSMGKTSRRINFALKEFSLSGADNANVNGSIVRNSDVYVFNFCRNADSVVLKGVAKNGRIISADFKFARMDILNLSRIFGCSQCGISGTADGCLEYKESGLVEFDIKAFDGILYGNEFKKFEAKGDVNLNRLKLKRFVLKNGSDKIAADMTGLVGFSEVNPVSSVYVRVNDLKLGKSKTNGCAVFHGSLIGSKKIKGIVRGTKTSISGLALGNVVANAEISPKGFRIHNLKADNGISARVAADFKRNKLSGRVCFKNANIKDVYPGVSGFLNSVVEFSGRLDKPDVNVPAFSAEGRYLSYFFSFSSRFAYRNSTVKANCATLFSDKTKITLIDRHLKDKDIFLSLADLTVEISRAVLDSNSPLKCFSEDSTALKDERQCLKMSLKIAGACIGTLRLNDIKSDVGVTGDSIEISSASAKVLNSEIRAGKGFLNIGNGKYGISLFLANIHAGPANLFGNVKLLGEVTKKRGNLLYSGAIALRDLWINNYSLPSYDFGYKLEGKTLRFFHETNDALCDFSGLVVFGSIVSVKEFNISKEGASFNLSGDFSKDSIDIKAKSSNTDWCLITDILNLPRLAEGSANVNVNLSRSISSLRGNISIASIGGSIKEIPYDTFEVEIDFSDDCARIKKAVIFKLDELNISVSGNFPFWFSSISFKEKQKKPINIFYEVEDHKLNVLKYLSAGFIKNHSGKMFLKGSVTGTYGKLNNSGKLSIKEGSFEVKNYIDRLKNMSVEISIDGNLVKIDKFDFKSGYGKLNVYGQLTLNNFNIGGFDLRFVTDNKGISLHVPQLPIHSVVSPKSPLQDYSTGRPCFDIRIRGTPEKPKVSGWALLKNTRFTFPGSTGTGDVDFIIPKNTEFDLELKAAKTTWFENSFVSALISGSVRLEGFYNDLKVRGIIKSSNGVIYYLGNEFKILSAKLEVSDDEQVYITADCEDERNSKKLIIARSNISDVSIKEPSQRILGEIARTKPDVHADLPELEPKLNFVIRQQVLRLLNENIAMPVVKTILRKFKIVDNLVVSYIPTSTGILIEGNTTVADLFLGTRYSVEKNLTNRILVDYSVTFNKFNRKFGLVHNIGLRYKLAEGLFLSCSYEPGDEGEFRRSDRRLMLQYQINFGKSVNKRNKAELEIKDSKQTGKRVVENF